MASPYMGGKPSSTLGCDWSSRFQNSAQAGFEPRTSQSNGRERYHSTTTHPLLSINAFIIIIIITYLLSACI